jgi:hypothetical protein
MVEDAAHITRTKSTSEASGLFTGTADAEERASLFTSSVPVVPPQA